MNSINKMKDTLKNILGLTLQCLGIIGIFIILACILFYIAFFVLMYGKVTVRSVNQYESILNKKIYNDKNILECFPKKIPELAENIEFYYTSPIFEDKFEMKLEFNTTKEEVKKYIDKYKDDRSRTIIMEPNGEGNRLYNYRINSYGFDLNEDRTDLIIYILWNSKESLAFIAVNEEYTEILFQAERW